MSDMSTGLRARLLWFACILAIALTLAEIAEPFLFENKIYDKFRFLKILLSSSWAIVTFFEIKRRKD